MFEQGVVDQRELAEALEQDFCRARGRAVAPAPHPCGPQIRQRSGRGGSAAGAGLPELSSTSSRAAQHPLRSRSHRRQSHYAGTSSISANVPGAATLATPDGRHARTPAGGRGQPGVGPDRLGPTAVFNSLGKLPTAAILGGVLLNQKLEPGQPGERAGQSQADEPAAHLLRGSTRGGTCSTTSSRETLLAAKAHPDQLPGSGGAVAGWSSSPPYPRCR